MKCEDCEYLDYKCETCLDIDHFASLIDRNLLYMDRNNTVLENTSRINKLVKEVMRKNGEPDEL